MRERGRSDRSLALTAWEDGGRAVLQVEAAPPKFGGVWSMAVTCQHNDGNLLFPHPRPSPATTVFVFGTAARAGEGGRWPTAVPNAVPHAVPNAVPNADERGRTTRGVPSRDRASPKRACRARSDSPGRRPGLRPLAARPCRGRSPWSGGESGRTIFGATTVRVSSLAAGSVNGPYRAAARLLSLTQGVALGLEKRPYRPRACRS
jgi:hypothetical protein